MALLTLHVGVCFGLALVVCRVISVCAYRLWFCPQAKFPGPKLAAVTYWYEFYYDIIKDGGGLYMWEIEKMHKKYGPIVRVNPTEIHVNDPAFYGEIYAQANRPRHKYDWHAGASTSQLSFAFTTDHAWHRLRREPLHPYFSRRSISTLEPLIYEKVQRLCKRLSEYGQTDRVVNLSDALVALTVDVITKCLYADSFDYLEADDFMPIWRSSLARRMKSLKLISHFPIISLLQHLPRWTMGTLPGVLLVVQQKQRIRRIVQGLLEENKSTQTSFEETIFRDLIDSNDLPQQEKSPDRIADEGFVMLGAGSDTVAKTLGIITVHLTLQPMLLDRLRTALNDSAHIGAEISSWTELEKIPLLTAVIKEGLRLHHGLTARNPRIAPSEDLVYKEWRIPAGVPVSSLPALIHLNPEIFPEPREFQPDRWLENGRVRKELDALMFSFGRGARACLGINLAYAELYIALATLVRRFDFSLYETDVSDVELERDFTIPTARLGSLGVQVRIRREIRPER